MPSKLCPFCRFATPISHVCPSAVSTRQNPPVVTPLEPHEETLLPALQRKSSILCQRCKGYDIASVFTSANPLDRVQLQHPSRTNEDHTAYHASLAPYRMELGILSELILSPECPLCRLVFRILPRQGLSPDDDTFMIVPFRSYVREAAWSRVGEDMKERAAVMLGLDHAGNAFTSGRASWDMSAEMVGEAICVEGGDKLGNGRFVGRMVDWLVPMEALETCLKEHGEACGFEVSQKLKIANMVDVVARKVVPCPERCNYFALSYVWGGVMPEDGALEKGTLPATIEDAIAVTRIMGMSYLWVDALCIDQSPNPTPEQWAEKEKQLRMMDVIYSSATLTLVAIAGSNSNAGLPGVNPARQRTIQIKEEIGGNTFFTIPPTKVQQSNASVWSKRAWTLQEEFLSRRYLFFSDTHVEFVCVSAEVSECGGASTITDKRSRLPESLKEVFARRDQVASSVPGGAQGEMPMEFFLGMIVDYTSRRMTNDGDSLNAILGLMSVWERIALSAPCVWGLPLADMPQSLGWMHHRSVSPRRRPAFPSWAWAGWEGEIRLDDMLFQSDSGNRFHRLTRDMTVRYAGLSGKELVVEGWGVMLEIRTDPFSDVLVTGTDEVMGSVVERNFLHPNTLKSGSYECLVIERLIYQLREGGANYNKVFLVVLDRSGPIAQRGTTITLTTSPGRDFMCLQPVKGVVRMV
ncbi:heterokaryon incompatibility protein-domain-containing protein [Podospora aff. communis PSN243]|uniref:Heterokaryon incompatibility protein-domain-containing protein n=1 Tax=Podospora aff. communis PSN243 TaxID=3040156 RepID=A0AAV9GGS0_9PEZI|nr:heterokaryon incompatibility protein-domain-containing protein [Podospora aff. communis PSN243]